MSGSFNHRPQPRCGHLDPMLASGAAPPWVAPARIGSYRTVVDLADREHAHLALVRGEGYPDLFIARILHRHLAARAEMVEEFLRVGRLLQRIRHANLVRVHDVGTLLGGQPYMVMDYVHGQDAGGLLAQPTRRHYQRVIDVGLQVASGLAAAHESGLLHLDLTTASVLLVGGSEETRIQIVNFQMAAVMRRWVPAAIDDVPWSMGAPAYWSPERAKGGELDARSDLYSLGVILFELLTGSVPFRSHAVDEVIAQHLYADVPAMRPLPDTLPSPGALQSVVRRCLAKDPSDRFQSAKDLCAALRSVAARKRPTPREHPSLVSSSTSGSGRATSSASARWAWRFITGIAGCAAAIALIIGLRNERPVPAGRPGLEQQRPGTIRITVTSDPPGALVYRAEGGAPLGRTPFTLSLSRSDDSLVLYFRFPDGGNQVLRTVPGRSMRLHARHADGQGVPPGDSPGDS